MLMTGVIRMTTAYTSIEHRPLFTSTNLPGDGQRPEAMQGHWVLARVGKRVLRPGGLELTRKMLDALAITPEDRVIEFAPGLGVTARMVLQKQFRSYQAVEREPRAVENLREQLKGTCAEIVQGRAQTTGLPSGSASVVYGEAMLSMQCTEDKSRIIAEARRLLQVGGRYGIHELCFRSDQVSDHLRREIQAAMAKEIHVGVQPLLRREWASLFENHDIKVIWSAEAPMNLLEPRRLLSDEGISGALRVGFNIFRDSMLRQRVFAMRRVFQKYQQHIGAIAIVGVTISNAQ